MRWAGAALLAVALLVGCATRSPLTTPDPAALSRAAPDSFDVRFETTRGAFVVRARRVWSPQGVDRFHYLAKHGYYDGARFFRVIAGLVAQFGLSGQPALDSIWSNRPIPDEPVRHSNVRGTVSYARGGPNTRSVQLYVNLGDNARLDTLNTFGFPPIAEVVAGMDVVDSLYMGYGGTRQQRLPGPSQDSIRVAGNGYLDRAFPKLDLVRATRVIREWR
jgi:cyclophilin family peptidyl-prolyl cis-trans isomerase